MWRSISPSLRKHACCSRPESGLQNNSMAGRLFLHVFLENSCRDCRRTSRSPAAQWGGDGAAGRAAHQTLSNPRAASSPGAPGGRSPPHNVNNLNELCWILFFLPVKLGKSTAVQTGLHLCVPKQPRRQAGSSNLQHVQRISVWGCLLSLLGLCSHCSGNITSLV